MSHKMRHPYPIFDENSIIFDAMKDELTALMHTEFFHDQEEITDILVMTAYVRIKKGEDKDDVLKSLNLAGDVYQTRYDSIFGKYLGVQQ